MMAKHKPAQEGTRYRCSNRGCGCEIVVVRAPGSPAVLPAPSLRNASANGAAAGLVLRRGSPLRCRG